MAKQNRRLHEALELRPDFAVRRGELVCQGWKLGSAALKDLARNGARQIEGRDLVPNVQQKGVDLCMGLDIARLAFKRIVDTIVVVTGDSDLIPALKTARIEGLRVFLETLGHGVRRELRVHADVVLDCELRQAETSRG